MAVIVIVVTKRQVEIRNVRNFNEYELENQKEESGLPPTFVV